MGRYWLTPPEIRKNIELEFGPCYDPCPFPRKDGFDGLTADWESPAYVNAPFGKGTMAWTRKAIAEHKKGKTIIMLWPYRTHFCALADAGAKVRSLGRPRFLEVETGELQPNPGPCALFIMEVDKPRPSVSPSTEAYDGWMEREVEKHAD